MQTDFYALTAATIAAIARRYVQAAADVTIAPLLAIIAEAAIRASDMPFVPFPATAKD